MYTRLLAFIIPAVMLSACNNSSTVTPKTDSGYAAGTFGYDLHFLSQHDSVFVLTNGESKVIVSPKYQAKVFTSTAAGDTGLSFGWVHYKAFDGPLDPHMNAYGGENRFWLGPEGGKFSLFFPPGSRMEFANWKTPAPFDSEAWDVISHSADSVDLRKDMQLVNYAGTRLSLSVDRRIRIMSREAIFTLFGLGKDSSVAVVGYITENTLTNTGGQAWTETTGMPCMWLLDMFPPSPSTHIIIPYKTEDGSKPATTDYFGEIPADRLHFDKGVLVFNADGKSRGKLGIHPNRALPVAGSYDSVRHVLTVITFDVAGSQRYLNQEWNTTKPPFSGDAVNAYNDGPLATGGQMGPFYELESVSPAAFLAPGGKQVHWHTVFHFTGSPASLDKIAKQMLGVGLGQIKF